MRFQKSSQNALTIAFFCLLTAVCGEEAEKVISNDKPVDIIPQKPGPATMHTYSSLGFCSNDTIQPKTVFHTDRCHNLNLAITKEFQILSPPVCNNGSRAEFTAFKAHNCFGDVWHSWEVTDTHVDQCLGAEDVKSFAFVCEGINRDGSFLRLIATLLLIAAVPMSVLGLLLSLVVYGPRVVIGGAIKFILLAVRSSVALIKSAISTGQKQLKPTTDEEKVKKDE